MTKEHKHKDLIIAWATGAVIQYRFWNDEWKDCQNNKPEWDECVLYRVKPEPLPDYSKFLGLYEVDGDHKINGVHPTITTFTKVHGVHELVNRLELIFDGESKELKKVKIHSSQ